VKACVIITCEAITRLVPPLLTARGADGQLWKCPKGSGVGKLIEAEDLREICFLQEKSFAGPLVILRQLCKLRLWPEQDDLKIVFKAD